MQQPMISSRLAAMVWALTTMDLVQAYQGTLALGPLAGPLTAADLGLIQRTLAQPGAMAHFQGAQNAFRQTLLQGQADGDWTPDCSLLPGQIAAIAQL